MCLVAPHPVTGSRLCLVHNPRTLVLFQHSGLLACRHLWVHGPLWAVSISNGGHISPLPLTLPLALPLALPAIFLLCLPSSEAFYSVGLKFGTRVLSLEANICHRVFRKSLGSFWLGDGESYPATCTAPKPVPHQAGGPAAGSGISW